MGTTGGQVSDYHTRFESNKFPCDFIVTEEEEDLHKKLICDTSLIYKLKSWNVLIKKKEVQETKWALLYL